MQVIAQGLLTTYVRAGTGKQVLILPGWADTIRTWSSFIDKLSKHYDVVALDLPGFGGTQVPPQSWGLDDYAGFVAAFVNKLELKTYAVVGHSNGGAIAIRALSQDRLQADKLVLLASAGIRGEYKGRNHTLRVITKAGKALTTPLPKSVKKRLRRKVYDTIGSDMLVAEHLQETFKRVVSDDVRADAQNIIIPTLLVYGEDDRQTPVRYGEALHEAIAGSTLEILPGAEHFVHIDRPAEVLQCVEEFYDDS